MLWKEKEECIIEAEQLAVKGLLFWKGRGTVPAELAAEEEVPYEDGGMVDGEEEADEAVAVMEEDLHDDEEIVEQEPK
eukprot:1002952-Amphidinium_carterae.1